MSVLKINQYREAFKTKENFTSSSEVLNYVKKDLKFQYGNVKRKDFYKIHKVF